MKAINRKKRRRIRTVVIPKQEHNGLRIIDMLAEKNARERAAFDETKQQRMMTYDVDEKFAKTQECGHPIGRLARHMKWNNETAARRIAAGFMAEEILTNYSKDCLLSPNRNPRAMDMTRAGGRSTREVDEDAINRASNRWMALNGALESIGPNKAFGAYLRRLLEMLCCEGADWSNWPPKQIDDAVKALDAVSGI